MPPPLVHHSRAPLHLCARSQLDRFTIQVDVASLLSRRDWAKAMEVLDLQDPAPSTAAAVAVAAAAVKAPTSAFGAVAAVTTTATAPPRRRRAAWRGVYVDHA